MHALRTRRSATLRASLHAPGDPEPVEWASATHPDAQPKEARRSARRVGNRLAATSPAGSGAYGRSENLPKLWFWLYFRCFALLNPPGVVLIWHYVTTRVFCMQKTEGRIQEPEFRMWNPNSLYLLLRAMYAARASKSASLISVLRKNGITETPLRTKVFVTGGVKSLRSVSRAGFAPLYLVSKATVPGSPGP